MSNLALVADAFAAALPATKALTVAETTADTLPAGAQALAARYVGATTIDLIAVVGDQLAETLATSDEITPTDVLRAALSAAGGVVGDGVLHVDADETAALETLPVGQGTVYALAAKGDKVPAAWLVVAEHAPATATAPAGRAPLRVLKDVEMDVSVQVGHTRIAVRDLLALTPGSVLELDRAAGAPADILVNGRLIARGEIVVVDEDYGVRVTEVIGSEDC